MPRSSPYTLLWSEEHQQYELHIRGQVHRRFSSGESEAFSRWLSEQSSFAFAGQAGRVSVVKEARAAGDGYWYAYRTQDHHTRKRYLGPSARVTFARLEEQAKALTSLQPSPSLARTLATPASGQAISLLATRLTPPRLPLGLVERARLLRELDAILTHPLTLVSATAGSGKTTLLSAWVASASLQTGRELAPYAHMAVAWLSLETLDNDPIRFWTSCVASLQNCLPSLGVEALALLRAQEAPPLSTILVALLNEIMQFDREVVLILDDFHLISEQAIHEGLSFALDHLPANLHLVLATRTDPLLPLSRLRARGQLLEIRSGDLRFTQEESTTFLLHQMGLPLSQEDVTTLNSRTEGWIAGLRLAALSLRKQQDLSGWVSDFAGSHRYLLDYVQQDILAGLPVPLLHFLLQTSVVSRMNAALCHAITASPSLQDSQQMLEEAEQANLFVVPLDEQRQWYRYHDLFREALHVQLHASQPQLLPLLHTRAARWYETQGEWREAITHALAAPDHPLTASLMEQAAPHFWLSGEARTMQNLVLALPDSVLCGHVRLALNAALRFLNSVHISTETVHASMAAQVQRTITRMETILHGQEAHLLSEAEVALIERRLCLLHALLEARAILGHGNKERLRLLTQELEVLPRDDEAIWQLIPLSFAFWLALSLQQSSASLVEKLREALQWISKAGDHLVTFRVMTWLATAYLEAGQLQQAYRECLSALTLHEQISGGTPVAGYLLFALFNVSYAWNRLDEAADALRRLLRIAQDWQQVELLMIGERSTARLALARGDLRAAQEALQKAETLFGQEQFANNVRWVVDTRVQIWLTESNLNEASAWAAGAESTLSRESWDPLRKWEVLLLARVALAQQKPLQAVETLERFNWHQDQPADIEKTLEWMALYVVALLQAGKTEHAQTVAARLLAMTEPEGYIRLYLDAGPSMEKALTMLLEAQSERNASTGTISPSYVLRLLAAFEQVEDRLPHSSEAASTATHKTLNHSQQNAVQGGLIEPLSRQEQQVLRFLVEGHTYAEMAAALVVSPNTIKTQVSSIYRKLGVSRRAEAIAVVQRLHLL
ncbi:MAG TPA: LuxR C-terminal-related transcriptional regulator [Ktedonobacteraceae bacterium]|nr:LuxR C-terminal-related transcriptional regulator [Ktedonobacteraceae bacterium]